MALKEKILKELSLAVKERKELELSVLRQLSAAILNKEKEKRYKASKEKPEINELDLQKESQLTEEEVLVVVSSEAKKRKEAIPEYERGGRPELAEKEKKELEVLQKYLPEQISEEELRKLARESIRRVGAKEMKDIGKVMAELMPEVKGRADGNQVSQTARELLSKDES